MLSERRLRRHAPEYTAVPWLLRPSKLPKAPPWSVVFLFGAAYNAVIERCWWATLVCLGVLLLLPTLDRIDRKIFG